jgi:hypothetical protein
VPVDKAPRHRPHQVLMRDRVEGRHDTLPTSRCHDSSGSFGDIIHLKGKRSKSSAASTDKVGCA